MARKQVYKITYPNGKIYVGMDLTGAISYFGSPSAKERIAADLTEHRLDLSVRKEILWESTTATDAEVRAMEQHFIRETGANNPAFGYNLTPKYSQGGTDQEPDTMIHKIPPNIDLDNTDRFSKVLDLKVRWTYSYADMRPGKTDREKREKYREAAAKKMTYPVPDALWWAFRISVEKAPRLLDLDNVAKLIVDAFCRNRIGKDNSAHRQVGLYDDDTLDYVRAIQMVGAPGAADRTRIEVFACIKPETR